MPVRQGAQLADSGLMSGPFKYVVMTGLVVVAILALGAAGAALYLHTMKQKVAAAEQRVRNAGQPVTLDELNAFYPSVPIGSNAALVYEEGFDKLKALDPGDDQIMVLLDRLDAPGAANALSPDLQQDIRAHLVKCREVLAIMDRAMPRLQSRYPLDLREGFNTELPHLAVLRGYARLDVLRGAAAIAAARPGDFVQSQKSTLAIARSLREEPLLISQLVRIAIHAIGVQSLADDLGRGALRSEDLAALHAAYQRAEDPDAMIRAFAGERCCIQSASLSDLLGDSNDEGGALTAEQKKELERLEHLQNAVIPTQRLTVYESMAPYTAMSGVSWPDRLVIARKAQEAIKAEGDSGSLVRTLVSPILRAVEAFAREAALLRMAGLACGVEQFRVAEGRLPEKLDQLVPRYMKSLPEDPFDGQPLRYKVTGNGYKLYTVYADGKDDGGVQATKSGDGGFLGDWVFEVKR